MNMLDDKRPIKRIVYRQDGTSREVGHPGCTKIEVYSEPGLYDFIPYIAVWDGQKIVARLSAWAVEIVYE